MLLLKRELKRLPLWLLSLGLLISLTGCWINLENVTIQESTFVAATGGQLSAGCDVTHLISGDSSFLTEDECLQFIQLQSHVDSSGNTVVDHYAAIMMSLNDFETLHTELETICTDLGSHCSYALQTAVQNMKSLIDKHKTLLP